MGTCLQNWPKGLGSGRGKRGGRRIGVGEGKPWKKTMKLGRERELIYNKGK